MPNLTGKHVALTEYFSVFLELFQENCGVGLHMADKRIPFRYSSNHSTPYTLGYYFFSPWRNSPPVGQGLIVEDPQSHSDTHTHTHTHTHHIRLLCMSDRAVTETST